MTDYADLKALSIEELGLLADDAREEIISVVQKNGGHLASNLGVVELTFALHYVFDIPRDKLIFDVGHQCYAHKLITRGSATFAKIRKRGGPSGFINAAESECDCFSMGHSSNSLSVAVGFARARDILKDNYEVVSVVGDGAMGGGEYFEALNDSAPLGKHVIIINCNEYSIERTVGKLQRLLSDDDYAADFFKGFGYDYVPAVDGHDIGALVSALKKVKEGNNKAVVMVRTEKGYGLKSAEANPEKYHSVGGNGATTYAQVAGAKLCEFAENDERIVAVTAAMTSSTGLSEFAKRFPDRFFDVGICEQHALSMCAAMAKAGLHPYFFVYASFLSRGIDQLINDVALQKLPVTIVVDHVGIVADDGETHQGNLISGLLRTMPNVTISAPHNYAALRKEMELSKKLLTPQIILYPKGGDESLQEEEATGSCLQEKCAACILTTGAETFRIGQNLRNNLRENGVNVALIPVNRLKSCCGEAEADLCGCDYLCLEKKPLIVLECSVKAGSFAESIVARFAANNVKPNVLAFNLPDAFIKTGTKEEILTECGFDIPTLTEKALEYITDYASR